jgi:NAD(P)-dependent dehydrogenase (short-subunit alcohol dehydrogenase family)
VTGAGSGIGREIASRLAREGARVVVADVDAEAGRETVEQIGSAASFFHADVTREADIAAMIDAAQPDILVNNAGGFDEPVFPDAPVAHWAQAMDLNLRSVMLGIHFAVRSMEGRGGVVVSIASTAGLGFAPHPSPEYAAAKAGVMRLTACLGHLAERGIRVNCVCPYTVGTPAVRRQIAELEAEGEALPPPLRAALLEPAEVADAVMSLIADESLAGRTVVLVGGKAPELVASDA